MTDKKLKESWAVTLRHLAASRYYLPTLLEGEALEAARRMEDYLHHNELGLALDEAEALGELVESSARFWEELRLAAQNMGMKEEAAKYARRLADLA
jgi:hypothetical protein